ncbi:MAG: gluconokinase, GntK/IdnK-type [Acidimicrobiales bacterium]
MDRVVIMGVAGCGKTTTGRRLAERMGAEFVEGDGLHPPTNVDKMASGVALTDADRRPWLAAVQRRLTEHGSVVVSCSALKRSYRDQLREAGGVRFVFLDVSPELAVERTGRRRGHYAGPGLVESQFAVLERPAPDEDDVVTLAVGPGDDAALVLARTSAVLAKGIGGSVAPLYADGGPTRSVTGAELRDAVVGIIDAAAPTGLDRVLLVPPDHTRLHSRAGEITAILHGHLSGAGSDVWVLPATGTHTAMGAGDLDRMFGGGIPHDRILDHDYRDGVERVGAVELDREPGDDGDNGHGSAPVPVDVSGHLLEGWDLVISIGQVVPHEVAGMANFTKNLMVGLGGDAIIGRTHLLGAQVGIEAVIGERDNPVRRLIDTAFDQCLADRVDVLWLLTVMESTEDGVVQRGLFAGEGRSTESGGAAFRAAADLATRCTITTVDEPFERVACRLDPAEFRTTWLANKAVYRCRRAMATGGELVILAPGVVGFGEDPAIDELIRRHGYSGTQHTLDALAEDPELAANPAAAAHLIQGSSEGRFRIVYCTDPEAGGLTQAEVEGVGFAWRPLAAELAQLGVDDTTSAGDRLDGDGRPFHYLEHPALGLWTAR